MLLTRNELKKALQFFYNQEDLQGGRDEYWENYRIIEKAITGLEIMVDKLSPLAIMTFLPMSQKEFELIKEILQL